MANISSTYFTASDELSYLRKVYAWLVVGILTAGAAGYTTLNFGTAVDMEIGGTHVSVPPLTAMMANHGIFFGLGLIGLAFVAGFVRKVPGLNLLAYFGITSLSGAFCAPAIVLAQAHAKAGLTMSSNPVRDAFALTLTAFVGLSAYTLVSRRDFSAMGAFLWTGLLVVIGASILGIFLQSRAYDLAVSSVAVLLFTGYILFDTSRLLHDSKRDDAIGDALHLYLDVLNLFVHLLRILGGKSKS